MSDQHDKFDDLDAPIGSWAGSSAKIGYVYFVGGHSFFTDGLDEPQPINFCTAITREDPILNDEHLDDLLASVKAELDKQAAANRLRQAGHPVVRDVTLLHRVWLDKDGKAIRPL